MLFQGMRFISILLLQTFGDTSFPAAPMLAEKFTACSYSLFPAVGEGSASCVPVITPKPTSPTVSQLSSCSPTPFKQTGFKGSHNKEMLATRSRTAATKRRYQKTYCVCLQLGQQNSCLEITDGNCRAAELLQELCWGV